MSNSVSQLFETFDKAVNALEDYKAQADALGSDFCRSVVVRNHALQRLAALEDGQERKNAAVDEISRWSELDFDHKMDADLLRAGLNSARFEFISIRDNLTSLIGQVARNSDALRTSLAQANSQVASLTERNKEHALHNPEIREAVWAITGGKCFYCEVELLRCQGDEPDRSRCFHIDHIVPKSCGGPDHLSNYVPACERCNFAKSAKSYVEFVAWRKAQQPQLTVIEGGAVSA